MIWQKAKWVVLLWALMVMTACGGADGTEPSGSDAGLGDAGECLEGSQGCACLPGNRCGENSLGEQLTCVGGVCEASECVPGETGCACRAGSECDEADATCRDGFCAASDCRPGQENCECVGGSCGAGLFCQNGTICVDATGYEGGPCLANGTCHRGSACDPTLDVCVHCEPGSAGCNCTELNSCNPGLACSAGRCVEAADLPPVDPVCYTPCRGDLVADDGTVRQCSTEGLLEGCVGDTECIDGSCLPAGSEKPFCQSDLDCPDFQTCLEGGCYSNCDIDADCPTGLGCYRKVCRTPCDSGTGGAVCDNGDTCEAPDGQNGYCVPVSEPQPEPVEPPTGGFALSAGTLGFSNIKDTRSVQVTSKSDYTQEITVRKLEHTIFYEDGSSDRVVAPRDTDTGEYLECDAALGECPLDWLELSDGQASTRQPTITLSLRSGCSEGDGPTACPTFEVSGAGNHSGVRWQGKLKVSSGDATAYIDMTYVQRPDGQWAGTMYYFGSFEDQEVDRWLNGEIAANQVPNGLVAQWASFSQGRLNDGWQEFLAILNSTRTGSWQFENVKDKCKNGNGTLPGIGADACYPYSNTLGVRSYVQELDSAPIPTGVVEFPIAMNLRQDATAPNDLSGRIVTNRALHYPANPAVSLKLAGDPADAASCDPDVQTDCVVFLDELEATINVPGRYITQEDCATGYTPYLTPWLVDGFTSETFEDQATGQRYQETCRGNELPFDITANGDPARQPDNENLALANPIPDGLPRTRHLELLAGGLMNQSEMFILFRERFESFIPKSTADPAQVEEAAAYGYMILKRSPADLEPEDFEGAEPPAQLEKSLANRGGAVCSVDLLQDVLKRSVTSLSGLTDADRELLIDTLIDGTPTTDGFSQPSTPVHYLCEDAEEERFNAGADGNTVCTPGSEVTYFVVNNPSWSDSFMRNVACQSNSGVSCRETLNNWLASGQAYEPLWRCQNNAAFCSDNRSNLRDGKEFFKPDTPGAQDFMLPIKPLIESAFRYKVRFQSDDGGSLGFVPDICIPNSNQKPYCYDPQEITEVRERIDCLVALYSEPGFNNRISNSSKVNDFLRDSFSQFTDRTVVEHEGFERLYAELLIMIGDGALTRAYSSRFDLAATSTAAFEGSAFEQGGIDLSGVAGSQMHALYQAIQYYQMALDRLYRLGPNFGAALERGSIEVDQNFVSQETVTLYMERLIRAATQKATAWGEVAQSYQSLNRPDLARTVTERAYAGTYLEAALLTDLMGDIIESAPRRKRDQIRLEIENAQIRLRTALRDMREVHESINNNINYFGFAPEYIPFPALDVNNSRDNNAFEVMRRKAEQKVALAKQRELNALSASTQQRTDKATFQSELLSVKNTYENNLARLCGTFTGDDGRVYPATKKYAHLSELTSLAGDPCGAVRGGEIYQARGAAKDAALALQATLKRFDNVEQEIDIVEDAMQATCDETWRLANAKWELEDEIINIQDDIAQKRIQMNYTQRLTEAALGALEIGDCDTPLGCAASVGLAAASAGVAIGAAVQAKKAEQVIADKETQIAEKRQSAIKMDAASQCNMAEIDQIRTTETLMLQLDDIELEALRGEYALKLAVAAMNEKVNEAKRWETQQAEAEQMLINIEAARNDPNVRIYRNDAVINADIAFKDARRAVYRTTKVFEYYTSQSYAAREELFIIRMITAGQKNLENYLIELDNAFFDFEEQFGTPATRIMVLSLRDDILQIPLLDGERALTTSERTEMLRERLTDVDMLDSNGYLTIPFSTDIERLSPLTRNHKIYFVEADIVGSGTGDSVGRLYLREQGTGVIHNVEDEFSYFVFPERTAVINPFFNGSRVYDPSVYRNFRLRDRPLVNTSWELVFNQRDELANRDIDLGSISDIRLLFYYTDFTAL